MCSLIKDKTTDKRKNQRDLKAVIGDGIIYAICALGISYVLSSYISNSKMDKDPESREEKKSISAWKKGAQ